MTTQQRVEEASHQFAEALRDAWAPADIQQRGMTAYTEYLEVMQHESSGDVYKRVQDAYARYMLVVQDAFDRHELQERARDAYRAYLCEVRNAWAEADVDHMTAPVLAAISQAMLSTAYMAAAAMPNAAGLTIGMPAPASQSS